VADSTVCGVAIGLWPNGDWNVNELSSTFADLPTFNADISGWDVSAITKMDETFMNAEAFNQDISSWDMSNVHNTESMFSNAAAFNADISEWDVTSITNMNAMLNNAQAFDQNISGWDVSRVTSMSSALGGLSMYDDCQKEELFEAWNATSQTFRNTYGSASSTDSSFYAAECNATTEAGNPQSSDDDTALILIGVCVVLVFVLGASCVGMLAVRRLYAEPAVDKPVSSGASDGDYY
jgi:surface protein